MAEAKEQKNKEPEGTKATVKAPAQPAGGPGKLISMAVLGVLVLLACVAGLVVGKMLMPGPQQAKAQDPADPFLTPPEADDPSVGHKYIDLERMTISLKSNRGPMYLITVITLKVKEPFYDAVSKQVQRNNREIKDMLNNYLGSFYDKDVLGSTNQNRIKRELADRLNNMLWPGKRRGIDEILFSEWHLN
jgi:flagellar basal body-associated protein FliL